MPQPLNTSRLFPDSPAGPPGGVYIANIDGASRGNPGPASYALILRDPSGAIVFRLGKKLGRDTNNVAEYYALLATLDYAVGQGIKALRIRSDSELLVRQMKGQYKVKSADLKPLHERAVKLSRQLQYLVIEHVPREMNREADALANAALDGRDTQSEAAQAAGLNNRSRNASAVEVDPAPAEPGHREGTSRQGSPSETIHARVVNGALVPSQPLDLPEGTDVIITIRKSRK